MGQGSNSMRHCNGNQICAIDTETTGLQPGWHEMIELAIIPLDSNLEPRKDVIPFNILLKPDYPERASEKAMEINKITFAEIGKNGLDREDAKDVLDRWIDKLGLIYTKWGTRKKIIPLGQNYAFDKAFILDWLGVDYYNELFDYHFRDTMAAALYLNDRAAFHGEKVPFKKVNLSWLSSHSNVERDRAHRALEDALATAQVYQKMCLRGLLG